MSFEGWDNYETWLIDTWMGSTTESEMRFRTLAQNTFYITPVPDLVTRSENTINTLATIYKELYVAQANECTGTSGVFADLLNRSLSKVNWKQIAQKWIQKATGEGRQ